MGGSTELREKLYTAYLLVQWIVLSSVLILLNKHILSTAGFNFPVTLVLIHMSFCSLCALIWKLCGWITVPHLGGPAVYCVRFVPVGLFFAASLSLGNAAYLFISVAFVQMLKASTPVATLLVSLCLGLERPSCRLGLYIMLVSCGIIASCVAQVVCVGHVFPARSVVMPDWPTDCVAQINPSVPGVLLQLGAISCEAVKLCLVNILLTSRGFKLSPVASLYFIAPVCTAALLPVWAAFEATRLSARGAEAFAAVGIGIFAVNLCLAFVLNIATMALIQNTSALTLNVAGVIKDLILIGYSVVVSGAMVSTTQYSGYFVAFVGVTAYSSYKPLVAGRKRCHGGVCHRSPPGPLRSDQVRLGCSLHSRSEAEPLRRLPPPAAPLPSAPAPDLTHTWPKDAIVCGCASQAAVAAGGEEQRGGRRDCGRDRAAAAVESGRRGGGRQRGGRG